MPIITIIYIYHDNTATNGDFWTDSIISREGPGGTAVSSVQASDPVGRLSCEDQPLTQDGRWENLPFEAFLLSAEIAFSRQALVQADIANSHSGQVSEWQDHRLV